MRTDRRLSLSLTPEQVQWVHSMLMALSRGADCTIMLRSDTALSLMRVVARAKVRADKMPPKPGRTHCQNGHEQNSEHSAQNKRTGRNYCRTCERARYYQRLQLAKDDRRRARDEAERRVG